MASTGPTSFNEVRDRLDEIVEAVNAEGISLDDALALYEEAVKLGMQACDLSEEDAEELLAQEDQAASESAPGEDAPADATCAAESDAADAASEAPAVQD